MNPQKPSIDYYTRLTIDAIMNLQSKDGSAFSLDINTKTHEVLVSFEEDVSMLIMYNTGDFNETIDKLKACHAYTVWDVVDEYFKAMNGDYL